MSEEIIKGFFLIGAAAVGGILTIFASRSGAGIAQLKEKNSQLQKQIERLLKQVEAYHLLEDLYAETIASQDPPRAVKTIKEEYREKVVSLHQCTRPNMTANEAKRRLENIT